MNDFLLRGRLLIAALLAGGALAGACGGDDATTSEAASSTATTTASTATSSGGSTSTGANGGGGATSSSTTSNGGATSTGGAGGATTSATTAASMGGSGGNAPAICTATATNATRGAAIALSADESRIVAVNRDSGSVAVMSVDYSSGLPAMTVVDDAGGNAEIAVGAEPWEVAIDACGTTAYVVLRADQKVVEVTHLDTTPVVNRSVSVGSEPTAIAISPNNTKLYVANWVDGTMSTIDPVSMTVVGTTDFNTKLASSGVLGATVAPRPALAHPRAIAVSNNGDANDDDETVYVTEWFAQRSAPESADGSNSDVNKQGLVYAVAPSGTVSLITLPAVANTGFLDHKGNATGCFPNQVGAITIDQGFAYVTSVCASPAGPLGVFQKGACSSDAQCASVAPLSTCESGACTMSCAVDSDCGATAQAGACDLASGRCAADFTDVKTTTHPAVSVITLAAAKATTTTLDAMFTAIGATRMPLLPNEVGFHGGFGYVAGEGADALFRFTTAAGAITAVGSAANDFIDLRTGASDKEIRSPIGVAVSETQAYAFVLDDGTRDVTAIDLSAQAIAVSAGQTDYRITPSAALPATGTPADDIRRGKRFFNTGLGRWSLNGAAWGACGACHVDGLSDNVTWYFSRGPRQSVSLDGSFATNDPTDQRIFNWTAIADEVADFESNTRSISGGVGAIVATVSTPPVTSDRIDLAAIMPPQMGLQGASDEIADPMGSSAHPHSVIDDWLKIRAYIQSIRSPKRPTTLDPTDVAAGKLLFSSSAQGNCVGCHSGAKWTISRRFYNPGDGPNAASGDGNIAALQNISWTANIAGFPSALFPSSVPGQQKMLFGAPPAAEQLQCILRPVGTIQLVGGVPQGVSPADVHVVELRQDMVTPAQGAAANGNGFNPPSLLGLQVGAPYFHAGNARTLEEALSALFSGHHQSAVANVFNPSPTEVKQLVAYLLSIDESEPTSPIPAVGSAGGDLCHYP